MKKWSMFRTARIEYSNVKSAVKSGTFTFQRGTSLHTLRGLQEWTRPLSSAFFLAGRLGDAGLATTHQFSASFQNA